MSGEQWVQTGALIIGGLITIGVEVIRRVRGRHPPVVEEDEIVGIVVDKHKHDPPS